MNIKFNLANEDLIDTILEMVEEFYAIDGYPFDSQQTSQCLLQLMRHENLGRLWVIYDHDHIAGYVILTFGFSLEYNGRDAFIDELFLKKKYRGMGIGKITLDFLTRQARELQVNAIHLEVEKTNEKGNQLYQNNGFRGNNRRLLTKVID